MSLVLLASDFVEVMGWLVMAFFAMLVIFMFIAIFGDIFTRRDLSGWAKAGWIFLIFVLPLLGILFYMIFRPSPTEQEVYGGMIDTSHRSATSTDEISRAYELMQAGAIDQNEFDGIKRRALAPQ